MKNFTLCHSPLSNSFSEQCPVVKSSEWFSPLENLKSFLKYIRPLLVLLTVTVALGFQHAAAQTVKIGTTDYASIQLAVDAAVDGDVIEIAGTHTLTASLSISGKNITLRGTDPTVDIIQANALPATANFRVMIINIGTNTNGINVNIENLGIRHGVVTGNGGGILVQSAKGTDPSKGKITLSNLIIANNSATATGGGVSLAASSNADIIDCTIINNAGGSANNGGGVHAVLGNTYDSEINIVRSLVDGNTAGNGAGLYFAGGPDNNTKITNITIENSTISNNTASSLGGGNGGGGIWSQPALNSSNINLKLVHATLYNNAHTGPSDRNGISFGLAATRTTNFSAFNSIIVSQEDAAKKAIDFTNSNTTNIVNCLLGGTTNDPASIADVAKNNTKDLKASEAGIATTLTDEGGKVKVLALVKGMQAIDYCTVVPSGIILPTIDATGKLRVSTPDAGAFEYNGPTISNPIDDQFFNTGASALQLDLSTTFNDADGDNLALTTSLSVQNVVSASITGTILTITPENPGTTLVTVTADDGKGRTESDVFSVTVNSPPVVAAAITDKILSAGFGTSPVDLATVFSDPNTDALTLSVVVADENIVTAAISGTTLTITEVNTGSTTVTITANDGKGGTVNDEFTVTVNANNAPTVANAIADKLYQVGFTPDVIDVSGTFADADLDVLSLSVTVDNTAVVTAALSGTNLTITGVGAGTTTVTLTADDGKGGTVSDVFLVTVNAPPVVAAAITDKILSVGFGTSQVALENVFSDPNTDALTLSVVVADENIVTAAINGTTLTFTEVNAGSTTVTVTANDGKGGSVSDEFLVTITVNNAPVVANALADKFYQVGFSPDVIDVSGTFADADLDVLSLSVTVNNTNVATAAVSGTNLTITGVGAGSATVTLTADDGKGGTVSDVFTVSVNAAPVVAEAISDKSLSLGFGTSTVDLSNVFSDPDSDPLTVSVTVGNNSVATVALTGNTLTINEVSSGSTTITVTANDGKGGTVSAVFQVTINPLSSVRIGSTSYETISAAITAAVDGDVIEITGTHTLTASVNISGKNITLRGTDPTVDIIQANAQPAAVGTTTFRVVTIGVGTNTSGINVAIENLGIRHGSATGNGGGILVQTAKGTDPTKGKITLSNLIIANNSVTGTGGGVSIVGSSDADIIDCTIINNTATANGGGVHTGLSSTAYDSKTNIIRSLIDNNTAGNGAGLYFAGGNVTTTDKISDVSIENSTISNNTASSNSTGNGGGGIWTQPVSTKSNITLKLVHVTMYNNVHTGPSDRNGISFGIDATRITNFSAFNSIIVGQEDITKKVIDFTNSNTTNVVNTLLGGTTADPTSIADLAKNNTKDLKASEAGIANTLTDQGGKVKMLALAQGTIGVDYCTATTGITLPTEDARRKTRDVSPDAGAFEFGNLSPLISNPIPDQSVNLATASIELDIANTFRDQDGGNLTFSVVAANTNVVTASLTGTTITITTVGLGSTTITVTANDGQGGTINDQFLVTVSTNNAPTVANALVDKLYQEGFAPDVIDVAGTFTDADQDALTLSVVVQNTNVVTAALSGTNLTITGVGAGTTTVALTANDTNGGTVTDTFTVTVNGAPVVSTPIDDQSLFSGFGTTTISLATIFSDPNSDALTFLVSVADPTVVTAAISGTTLTLTEVGMGTTNVTVTANDGNGGAVSDVFQVTVEEFTPTGVTVRIGTTFYETIADAITAAADEDIIQITGAHTLTSQLTINKTVTLRGTDPKVDIIQATEAPSVTPTFRVMFINNPNTTTSPGINVTIENIGIRHGHISTGTLASSNGGGILADRLKGTDPTKGKLTLRNVIIEENKAGNVGAGVAVVGSDADIIDCTIINNTASIHGGGLSLTLASTVSANSKVNIIRSLIDSNAGNTNGGGVYVAGTGNGNVTIDVNIENTIISNNAAKSAVTSAGGGGIWSLGAATDNVNLKMIHVTMYNNTHTSTTRNGISFGINAGQLTNFSLYNSIVVTAEDVLKNAIDFTNANTTDVVNSLIGGMNAPPTLIDNAAKNNKKDQKASDAGIATALTEGGGKVKVLALVKGKTAIDYCTVVPVGITLPGDDATGKPRDTKPDAGAVEFVDVNTFPVLSNPIFDQIVNIARATAQVDLSDAFSDSDGDALTYTVSVANTQVVTASVTGSIITITPVALGSTVITVTANDGRGGQVSDTFNVTVQDNVPPEVVNPLLDKNYLVGFKTATIDLSGTFTDADQEAITLSVTNSSQNIVTVSLSGTTLTVTEVGSGIATITVTATDGKASATSSFRIIVNTPPVAPGTIANEVLIKGFRTKIVDLANVFSDADGDELLLTVSATNLTIVTVSVSGTILTIGEGAGVGTSVITVTADDGKGGKVSKEFTVQVQIVLSAQDESVKYSVYPNPTTSFLKVDPSVKEVIITGMNGVGTTYVVQNGEVDVTELSNGSYILHIPSLNIITRFIKQ